MAGARTRPHSLASCPPAAGPTFPAPGELGDGHALLRRGVHGTDHHHHPAGKM